MPTGARMPAVGAMLGVHLIRTAPHDAIWIVAGLVLLGCGRAQQSDTVLIALVSGANESLVADRGAALATDQVDVLRLAEGGPGDTVVLVTDDLTVTALPLWELLSEGRLRRRTVVVVLGLWPSEAGRYLYPAASLLGEARFENDGSEEARRAVFRPYASVIVITSGENGFSVTSTAFLSEEETWTRLDVLRERHE